MRDRLRSVAIAVCFFFSGAAGLLYEVVWLRLLGLAFGSTVFAVTTVLAAFMGGLALGSFLFGRWADRQARPVRMYAAVEAGVGLFCLATPVLFDWAHGGYLALHRGLDPSPLVSSFLEFFVAAGLLLVPTTLMGATLPLLSRAVVTEEGNAGSGVGGLYAINILGAVAGVAAAGFFLLPAIGLRATIWLGAGLNLIAAVLAWAVGSWRDRSPGDVLLPRHEASGAMAGPTISRGALALAMLGLGVSGAAAMAYEIAWTRALSLVLGNSTYAFTAMLTTFLVGLALGALLFGRCLGRRPIGLATFGVLEVAIGLGALGLLPAFGWLPEFVLKILGRAGVSHGGALFAQFAASFAIMIGPTILMGAALPCVVQVVARDLARIGRDVGTAYAANTVGNIAGAMTAGFILIPFLGIQAGVTVAAGANVAVGAAALALAPGGSARRRRAAVGLLLAFPILAAWIPRWDQQLMVSGVTVYADRLVQPGSARDRLHADRSTRRLLFYAEGVNTTVSVERNDRNTFLRVNGKTDASNGIDMMTQLMLGHLPALLHPEARRAMVIGLGSGVTAGALAQHPLQAIDVAELEPAMVRAAGFFRRENRDVLRDPRTRVILEDGRHVLATATHPYDLIVSEPSNPWIAGVGNLFTREFYELARSRLADGGVMVQWVHGYALFPRELQMVVRTFREAFPHATVWRSLAADYLLVGTLRPLEVDYPAMERRFASSPGLREDFARFRWSSPANLLYLFLLAAEDAARYSAGAPLNTDDRPLLEFAAPLALYAGTIETNRQLMRASRRADYPAIRGLDAAHLTGDAGRLQAARAYWAMGETEDAVDQLARMGPGEARPFALRLERARLLFALGRMEEGMGGMRELARERPGDGAIAGYLRAGETLVRLGAQRAMTQHAQPSSTYWNPAEVHNNLGTFFVNVGVRSKEGAFFDLAIEQFEAALQNEPAAHVVINNLGNALFEKGRFPDAVAAYHRVLALETASSEARFNLGVAYEKWGKTAEAIREYDEAVRLAPGWALPRQNLARLQGGVARIPRAFPHSAAAPPPHPPNGGTGTGGGSR